MDREPIVVQESVREWETWPNEEIARKGLVYWKTLVSGDLTKSEALTMGIAKIPPTRRYASTGTGKPRSTSSSKEPARSRSTAKRGLSQRDPRSSYRATPCTTTRTRGRPICVSPTFSQQIPSRRSNTSSTSRPDPIVKSIHPAAWKGSSVVRMQCGAYGGMRTK